MSDTEFREALQKNGLDILARNKGGFQFTETFFPYASGEIGPYYVQAGVVQNDGRDFRQAIGHMNSLINMYAAPIRRWQERPAHFDVVAGGETRDWIFSLPAAIRLGKPHVMIYGPDSGGKLVGADLEGKNVILVADLNNEGSSVRDKWVPAIGKAGGNAVGYFCYVDRIEEGVRVLEELQLPRHAVVELDDRAWDYLQEQGVVDAEVYRQLRERGTSKEERDIWARVMLRTDPGLDKLAILLDDEKTREKGSDHARIYVCDKRE